MIAENQLQLIPNRGICKRYNSISSRSVCSDAVLNQYCKFGKTINVTQWPPVITSVVNPNDFFTPKFGLYLSYVFANCAKKHTRVEKNKQTAEKTSASTSKTSIADISAGSVPAKHAVAADIFSTNAISVATIVNQTKCETTDAASGLEKTRINVTSDPNRNRFKGKYSFAFAVKLVAGVSNPPTNLW